MASVRELRVCLLENTNKPHVTHPTWAKALDVGWGFHQLPVKF